MNHPKISIIVPVYNTSSYLNKCLGSIINQTFFDIELIIVNDCSPDPLDHEICIEYEKNDSRITYIKHESNRGLGGARNSGLDVAKGDYIWFVDSDDYIDLNACEFLHNLADAVRVDIIAFSATSHVNGSLNLSKKKYYYYWRDRSILDQVLSGKSFIDEASLSQSFHVSACLHLFKRQLISHFRFRENVVHEDTDLIPIVIYSAKSIYCIKYSPYYRLLREDSITQKEVSEGTLVDKFSCVEALFDYAEKYKLCDRDPLLNYIHNEFNNVKNIYLQFDKENKYMEDLFGSLNNRYKSNIEPPCFPFNQDENEGYKTRYLELKAELKKIKKRNLWIKQELDTIKNSRFWKITQYLRRIKEILYI